VEDFREERPARGRAGWRALARRASRLFRAKGRLGWRFAEVGEGTSAQRRAGTRPPGGRRNG